MRLFLALILALLSAWMANPASAANTIEWVRMRGGDLSVAKSGDRGDCWVAVVTTTNEANDTKFLFVGGSLVTLGIEPDSSGAGANASDWLSCTDPAAVSCRPLLLVDTDADGATDDNTLDGTPGKSGTLDPISVGPYLVVQPDKNTIDANELQTNYVCWVK